MAPGFAGEQAGVAAAEIEARQGLLRMMDERGVDFGVGFRQSDPGLDAVHALAGRALCGRRAFGMADAGAGRHPVHRARADGEVVAERILVGHRAFEEVGDGRKADMRVGADIETRSRRIGHGAEMVEEDEGADHFLRVERQDAADLEAAAEILLARADDSGDGVAGRLAGFAIGVGGLRCVRHGADPWRWRWRCMVRI